jgi:large repetitive protein
MTHLFTRRGLSAFGTGSLALMLAGVFAPFALAAPAPTISIDTSGGTTPYSVLQVSGTGFGINEGVRLYFGLSQATTSTDGTGAFSNAPLTVPTVSSGTYIVLAVGETSGTVAYTYVYVSAFMPLASPSIWWAPPGTVVTFAGSGYASGEQITATLAGSSTPLGTWNANASGAFTGQGAFMLPFSLRNSSAVVTLTSSQSGVSSAFAIGVGDLYPWANPSSWYILPGNSVTFSGGGFAPSEGVDIFLTGSSTVLASATADLSGVFSSPTLVMIPYGSGVAHFEARGQSSGATVDIPITRAAFYPSLNPSTYYSAPGGTISLAGTGFAPDETVAVTLGTASTSAMTNASGAFSIPSIQLPSVGGVTIPVTAVGQTSGATATFQMTMGQYYTWITLSSYWAQGGSPLTIFGHNFAPGEAVGLATPGGGFASTTADGAGEFALVTTVPFSAPGTVTITATGNTSGAPASVNMTVAPVWTDLQLASYAGAPGSAVEFVGHGYVANDVIELRTDRTGASPVATFSADAAGDFNYSGYTIPNDFVEGNLVFMVTGTNSFDTKNITYYVTGS